MIDKILSIFGLVRCLEYGGSMYPHNGYELYFTLSIPVGVKYNISSYISACIVMGAKSRIVPTNSFKAHQAMRCL